MTTDDIAAFQEAVEQCLKTLSRAKGKRQEYPGMVATLQGLLRSSFPKHYAEPDSDVEEEEQQQRKGSSGDAGSSRKRARAGQGAGSDNDGDDQHGAGSGTPISTHWRAALKKVVDRLQKLPAAEPFLYPVSQK